MALPFNLSAPTMYYNLDILAKAGYISTNFPRTWEQMEVLRSTQVLLTPPSFVLLIIIFFRE